LFGLFWLVKYVSWANGHSRLVLWSYRISYTSTQPLPLGLSLSPRSPLPQHTRTHTPLAMHRRHPWLQPSLATHTASACKPSSALVSSSSFPWPQCVPNHTRMPMRNPSSTPCFGYLDPLHRRHSPARLRLRLLCLILYTAASLCVHAPLVANPNGSPLAPTPLLHRLEFPPQLPQATATLPQPRALWFSAYGGVVGW
jgi:hypothetical protein